MSVSERMAAVVSTSMSGAEGCKGAVCGLKSGSDPGGIGKGTVCGGESGLEAENVGSGLCKAILWSLGGPNARDPHAK